MNNAFKYFEVANDDFCPFNYREKMLNERIEEDMNKLQVQTIKKLSLLFVQPSSFPVRDFALTLAYSISESHEPAESLAKFLDLSEMELFSLRNEFALFKERWIRDYENSQYDLEDL